VVKPDDEALAAPKLYIVTVHQLLCPSGGFVVIGATERAETRKMPIVADDVGPVLVHFGEASPGELTHSLMCEAVSACRARRKSSSRAVLPGRSFSAASLNRLASSASRCSKVSLFKMRLLPMALLPQLTTPEF
jgi:hypothetical protein